MFVVVRQRRSGFGSPRRLLRDRLRLGFDVTSALKDGLRESESALIASLAEYERYAFGQLDEEFRAVMQRLDAWFGNLERLAVTAFDPEVNNELLRASVRMAKTVGVHDALILRTTADLDTFMQK